MRSSEAFVKSFKDPVEILGLSPCSSLGPLEDFWGSFGNTTYDCLIGFYFTHCVMAHVEWWTAISAVVVCHHKAKPPMKANNRRANKGYHTYTMNMYP